MKRLASRQPKAGYTYIEYTCMYIYISIYIYIYMYIIHMSHTYLHKLDFLLQDSILFWLSNCSSHHFCAAGALHNKVKAKKKAMETNSKSLTTSSDIL